MSLSLIILISVVFVVALAWMMVKSEEGRDFCVGCGDELFGDEVGDSDKCNMCNAYERGEV